MIKCESDYIEPELKSNGSFFHENEKKKSVISLFFGLKYKKCIDFLKLELRLR